MRTTNLLAALAAIVALACTACSQPCDCEAPGDSGVPADDPGSQPEPDTWTPADAGADAPDAPEIQAEEVTPGDPCAGLEPAQGEAWAVFGGRPLGANVVAPGCVEVSIFAPEASAVHVAGDFNEWDPSASPLHVVDGPEPEGVWVALVRIPEPYGQRYEFVLDQSSWVADPYARANEQNLGHSIFVERAFDGWTDAAWTRPDRAELVIYELHVSDFTRDPSSGASDETRGRFPGLEARLDHLVQLGINAVELMPIAEAQSDEYGWGYNPSLMFAPEAWLATAMDGTQVRELKAMINALHAAGIAVILDVVYNHVWGQLDYNHFWDISPAYYFDYDDDGDPENDATPWGYRLVTWRAMVRKLIYDNLRMWMDEYHVDGFRFDATEWVHLDEVAGVVQTLWDEGYDDRYFVFEEFTDDHNARIREHNQSNGEVMISSWGTGYRHALWSALEHGAGNTLDLGHETFFSQGDGWHWPAEVINYFASHDEGTLAGRFGIEDVAAAKQRVRVATAHLLTSLGVPMLWMGEELLRVHYGNHPPAGVPVIAPETNVLDWSLADEHQDLVDYVGALVRLRIAHPALHLDVPDPYPAHFSWHGGDFYGSVGYAYHDVGGDHDFMVLVNYEDQARAFEVTFPSPGDWYLMCDGQQATDAAPGLAIRTAGGAPELVDVPARSALVYMSAATNP